MATKNAASARITINNLHEASVSGTEASLLLPLAAQAAITGKSKIQAGQAQGACALAVMVAGFASDETALRPWTFDMVGKDGQVKYHVECTGLNEFGGTEGEWRAEPKKAQTAYKTAFQSEFFNLTSPIPAVWTMASKAEEMARAIRAEGMTAKVIDGALVLEGGNGDRADAMRAAKSMAGLTKAVKGETGTNQDAPRRAKGGDAAPDTGRAATPSEILAAAFRLIDGAAKGEEALASVALDYARRIAALVAANPDAFAAD